MKRLLSDLTGFINVFMSASLIVVLLLLPIPAAAQNAKMPMTPDGHPDLNGFWNNPPGQAAQQFQRTADGSILFDFSIDQGKDELCVNESCQAPNQPPYKPEYMEKVKKIASTMVGGTT